MAMPIELIILQSSTMVPAVLGILLRPKLKESAAVARAVIMINLVFLEPVIVLWATWKIPLSADLVALPLAGLLLVGAGFAAGVVGSRILSLEDADRKTFTITSSLANHGYTMGGLVCYMMLGETGLGLSSLFAFYFVPFTFIVIFSYAAGSRDRENPLKLMRRLLFQRRNLPLAATVIGLLLNLSGVPRPEVALSITPLVIVTVLLYYFSLGLTFEMTAVTGNIPHHLLIAFLKFILLPVATFITLEIAGIQKPVSTVIMIQSFMPAAVYSVITSVLFRLNTSMASAIFVINTVLFLVAVLPFLMIVFG